MENRISLFTDGSSRGNPGPGGWAAVVVAGGKVRELGGREEHTTNNRMELIGAISALEFLSKEKITAPISLHTDSSYVINGITKWVHGWKKKNWISSTKEPVMNRDLWERLLAATEGKRVEWIYVGGHAGVAGNERCDVIATSFADGAGVSLYDGTLENYPVKDILNISRNLETASAKSKSKSNSKAKAYSYLSLLDGKVQRHTTWADCEARVKGKPAKFKKALSADDERTILAAWGVKF